MCQACFGMKMAELGLCDEPYKMVVSLKGRGLVAGAKPPALRVSVGKPEHQRRSHKGDEITFKSFREAMKSRPEFAAWKGPLFRFGAAQWEEGGDGYATLHLGVTSYEEYMVTNRQDSIPRSMLMTDGEREHEDRDAFLSNALSCEVVLVTSGDEKVAMLWRTDKDLMTPERFKSPQGGRYGGPVGWPEPGRAGLGDAAPKEEVSEAQALATARELADSVTRGVQNSLGVPMTTLGTPAFLGVMRDSRYAKPELLFGVRTSLDASGVRAAFTARAGASPDDELDFWPAATLADCPLAISSPMKACIDALPSGWLPDGPA